MLDRNKPYSLYPLAHRSTNSIDFAHGGLVAGFIVFAYFMVSLLWKCTFLSAVNTFLGYTLTFVYIATMLNLIVFAPRKVVSTVSSNAIALSVTLLLPALFLVYLGQ